MIPRSTIRAAARARSRLFLHRRTRLQKTHGRRVDRLKGQGASDAALAKIHAPIGLAIGAVTPAEIAVAIMGEITAQARLPQEKRP